MAKQTSAIHSNLRPSMNGLMEIQSHVVKALF